MVVDRLDSLSQYARNLLLGPYEAVEPPIRAELFGAQRFEQHGHSLARAQVVRSEDSRGDATPFSRASIATSNRCAAPSTTSP